MIKRFKEISSADVPTCGGKWASLGELMRAWFPFSDWFVLTTEAFGIDHNQWKDKIYEAFDQLATKYVAVRSSATKEDGVDDSFAGQFETYLFVDRENLLEQIMECHKSINSDRIKAYCESKWIDKDEIKVAVVVQRMINSEVAGVSFTANPVTNNTDQVIIEWWYGLWEAVVSWMITPDNYLRSKPKKEILEKNFSTQSKKLVVDIDKWWIKEEEIESTIQWVQKLSDEHIIELAKISERIEEHYKKPMDIEWALEDGQLYILQARPITTIQSHQFTDSQLDQIKYSNYHFFWLRRNDIFAAYFWLKRFDKETLNKLGFNISKSWILILNWWHFFADKDILLEIDEIVSEDVWSNSFDKYHKLALSARKNFDWLLDEIKLIWSNQDITVNDFDRFVEIAETYMTYWCFWYLLSESFESHLADKAMSEKIPAEEIPWLIPKISSHLLDQQKDLWMIKKLIAEKWLDKATLEEILVEKEINTAFEKHTDEYWWIEMINYIWEKMTNEKLFDLIANHTEHRQSASYYNKVSEEFREFLDASKDLTFVRQAWVEYSSILSFHLDDRLKNLAKNLAISYRDMLHLTPPEIRKILENKLTKDNYLKLIETRRDHNWLLYFDEEENIRTSESKIDLTYLQNKMVPKPKSDNELLWQIWNQWYAKGKVRVIYATDDFHKFQDWDILVTTMTTPDFVPLMQKSTAIITDIGWMLSHAAIVSREMWLPSVIWTKFATQLLKDWDEVEVDADNGVVRIIEKNTQEAELSKKIETLLWDDKSFVIRWSYAPLFLTTWIMDEWWFPMYQAWSKDESLIVFSETAYGDIARNHFKNYLDDDFNIDDFQKYYTEKASDIIELYKTTIVKDLGNYSDNDVTDLAKSLQSLYSEIITRTLFIENFTEEIMADVLDSHQISKEDITIIVKKISDESFDSFEKRHEYKKGLLAQWWVIWNETAMLALYLYTDYKEVKSLDYIKNDLVKYKDIESKVVDNTQVQADASELHNKIARYCRYVIRLRDYRKDEIAMCQALFYKISLDVCRRVWIDKSFCMLLHPFDLQSWVNHIKKNKENIEARINGFESLSQPVNVLESNNIQIDMDEIENAFVSKKFKWNVWRIEWTTATAWHVIWNIKIVLDASQFNDFDDWDILVTSMTRPEFVPLMKKAWAIITNEGWITCHAAIVSRELGVPCIIWTKFATQFFKDWDEVEVDAHNGVVNIIKRSENLTTKVIKKLNNSYYTRLFQFDSAVPFIISDEFSRLYADLECMVVCNDNQRVSFMSTEKQKETNQEWLELYWDSKKYQEYQQDIINTKQEVSQQYQHIISSDKITKSDFKEYVALSQKFRYLYRLTEYFYTDLVYQQQDEVVKKNFETFEELKLDGRAFLNKMCFTPDCYFNWIISKLSKQFWISEDNLRYYKIDDAVRLFDDGVIEDKILLERKKWHLIYSDNWELIYEFWEQVYPAFNHLYQQSWDKISWTSASWWKVNGIVRVIKVDISKYDEVSKLVEEMNHWEILVAESTEPSIIAACNKASAIITNQWWMMSHAAIVSRELWIPCVVATGNATDLLKTWMNVEVDWDTGTISIFE